MPSQVGVVFLVIIKCISILYAYVQIEVGFEARARERLTKKSLIAGKECNGEVESSYTTYGNLMWHFRDEEQGIHVLY